MNDNAMKIRHSNTPPLHDSMPPGVVEWWSIGALRLRSGQSLRVGLMLLVVALASGCAGGRKATSSGLATRAAITATRSSVQSVRTATAEARSATAQVRTSTATAGRHIDAAQVKADEVAKSFVELGSALEAIEAASPKGNVEVARAIMAERQARQEVEALRDSLKNAHDAVALANGQAETAGKKSEAADARAVEADQRAQEADASAERLIQEDARKARALEVADAKLAEVTGRYHKLKLIAASVIAALAGMFLHSLLGMFPFLPLPWRWGLTCGAGAVAFAAAWWLF